MEKIFTFKQGLLKLFVLVALFVGGGSSALAEEVGIDVSFGGNFRLNGWEYNHDDGWITFSYSSAKGGYMAYSPNYWQENDTDVSTWISPIVASAENDKLTISCYKWQYASSNSYIILNVYYSKDKAEWTLAKAFNPSEIETSLTELNITNIPVGNYYIKIESNNIAFDYIYGLSVAQIPEMTVYSDNYGTVATNGKTTDFGLVTTAPSYTYYVKNTNRGTLYVEAEANGGYSVNPTKFTLEAGEQQAVTVTAPASGDSEGTLTLTGMNGEEVLSTFTANFKGDVMDKEGKFFEDFNGTSLAPVQASDLPGWDVDVTEHDGAEGYYGRTQFYNDNGNTVLFYYVTSNTDTPAYLITPKLHVKGTNDVMYFRCNGLSDGKITVSYSADKTQWTKVHESSVSSYTQKSFKNIPEGDYFVKFELWDATLDWVYGYVLAPECLVLDETVAPAALTTGVQNVELKYTAKAGWNTIALPFAVADLSVFGEGVKAYQLTGYNDGALSFEPVSDLKAGFPYVLYVETVAEANGNFKFEGVDITATEAIKETAGDPIIGFAYFFATYAPMAAGTMAGKYGVVPSTGKIQKGGANATMKGFRAYFELPAGANGARMIIDGEEVTSISAIDVIGQDNNAMYNLNGQRVNRTAKGIYIVNGKKMVVK